jgi:hypothetical protein
MVLQQMAVVRLRRAGRRRGGAGRVAKQQLINKGVIFHWPDPRRAPRKRLSQNSRQSDAVAIIFLD